MSFCDEDEVVISGIGGKFPEARSVPELANKLFAGDSLVTKDERVLTKGFYENLPQHHGKTLDSSIMFDNTFFGISTIVANAMDPLTCQILQRVFEAIIDAGINPSELRGTNSAVFSGTCHSDSDLEWATDIKAGYGIMGRNRCMNSNRVSYWLDLNGTSVSTDSGWTNGISNLYQGWDAIRSGKTDIAIVSTANLQSHPLITMQFSDFGVLSPDGISRTFDDNANGSCRSSAVVVFVLQRARHARRWYSTIGHIYFTCFGDRENRIDQSSQKDWERLFTEFYKQANIDVNDVHYIEAHGSSIREEDAEELNAIAEVFCKNRKSPILVGCVKSNIGNTEAASSFCGIVKCIIGLENDRIPQNLNYTTPNSLCPALAKGQIKVVDKNIPIPANGWVAVNCHGFGGTYGHIILKANPKTKTLKHDGIPRLVLLSDRTNDYMADLIEKVESIPYDPEFVALLHEINSKKVEKYLGRGYTILPKRENPIHDHQVYGEEKRPIWFIFSGMGSQWPTMGKSLLNLPIIRESIERSHKLLESKGLDLIKIITTDDPHIFDNILHSFVGIAAIQVALVDVLKALNITPDGLIGHSVGELGCAYADGCFTAEQMVLAAYYRGKASTETELTKGSMAAVGKGYKGIKDQLPEGIEVACHNSEDSCTLSGPIDLINKYVEELKGNGIFAKAVNVSNIAYHSKYIKPAAPKLLEYLKQVITDPKPRSSKWISTSNPESLWNTELAKYCSAEYHTNNLLSSVLFEEGSKHIPKNAICIEIAPHGLLQAILKRSLGENVTNIPLTSRASDDPLTFLLQAIGKMYIVGINPSVINLYPRIQYPVSKGTSSLHQLVHWHEQKVAVVTTPMEKKVIYSFKDILVNTAADGVGYVINDQNIYPVSTFLVLAWELFASFQKKEKESCPVEFQDFRIEHPLAVHLLEEDSGIIAFQSGSGNFEIVHNNQLLASGNISFLKETPLDEPNQNVGKIVLKKDEVYREIKRRGYDVGTTFKTLKSVSLSKEELVGEIDSTANWAQSIESLIQLCLLQNEEDLNSLCFPFSFERLKIACLKHQELKDSLNEGSTLTVSYDPIVNSATCGGINFRGLKCREISKIKSDFKFEYINFLPFVNPPLENSLKFADFCFGIALDNLTAIKSDINIVEIIEDDQISTARYLQQHFVDYKVKVKIISKLSFEAQSKEVFEFAIGSSASIHKILSHLIEGGFVLLKPSLEKKIPEGLTVIGKFADGNNKEYIFLKKTSYFDAEADFKTISGSTAQLISDIRQLKFTKKNVYMVGYIEPNEGIMNFKNRMQAETTVPLRWIFILDPKAPSFDSKNQFYSEQLRKGLTTNVYCNGSWRGYRRHNISEKDFEDENFTLEWSNEIDPSYISFELKENLLNLEQIEFSGKHRNKKVMGITKLINNKKIILDKYLTWEIPESWSLEEGAATPLAYALAYYCLAIMGKVKPWERVMVTDGMSCIGQATITLAVALVKRVFVTVNNNEEIALIKQKFPQINEKDICSHEDVNFDIQWKLAAKDEFAELIVNNLEGERFFSVLKCVGKFGRFFHFGKEDLMKNKQLGTGIFLLSLGFYCRSPDIITRLSENEKRELHELMTDGIKKGIVKPFRKTTLSFNELRIIQSKSVGAQKQLNTVLRVSTIKPSSNYVKFNSKNSFVIFGDETDVWVDIAEWLIKRRVENIVVGRRDQTKRSQLRSPYILKHKNVFIFDHQNVQDLLEKAEKLGPTSAVFYISMNSAEESSTLMSIDKNFRKPESHLIALTTNQDFVSRICADRCKEGFPSTNFVWKTDVTIINQSLEFLSKVVEKNPVVYVSLATKSLSIERGLTDLLPSSIDDFCDFGSSLKTNGKLTPLQTLTGVNKEATKEYTPILFIPGLQKDPVKVLEPLVQNFLYPAFCIHIPTIKMSIPKMASYILPEIIKTVRGRCFNIVGISWGTHLAIELAKQLEELGAVVGLILIEGPLFNAKNLLVRSLSLDLISVIQSQSKSSGNVMVLSEISQEKTWQGQMNKIVNILDLPSEKEMEFRKAANFIHSSLQALIDHDIYNINLKGPLTVLLSDNGSFDDKFIWKFSKSISIRYLQVSSDKLLQSPDLWQIIHGSTVSQAMSTNTIHKCSLAPLEEFLKQKGDTKLSSDFQVLSNQNNIKFSFSF